MKSPQGNLFSAPPPKFDGKTFDPVLDGARLEKQLGRVWAIMQGGDWWTLRGIGDEINRRYGKMDSEAGISARIRDLRKARFGSYTIEHRRSGGSGHTQWEYRLAGRA